MALLSDLSSMLFGNATDPATAAANANRAAANTAFTQGQNLLSNYQTGALGATQGALTSGLGALGTGLTNSLDALRTALGQSTGAATNAVNAYNPLSTLAGTYGAPVNLALGALGVGGPDATAAARGAFTSSPGYQFQVDEGTRAVLNAASKAGTTGTGNTLDAIRARAQGFASQDYGSWLNSLLGFVNPQLQAATTAAGGQAGGYKTLADLYSGSGTNIAGAYGTNAAQTAGLYGTAGADTSNILGNVLGGGMQSVNNLQGAQTAANNMVAQAQAADAASAASFWGNLGKVATGALFPSTKQGQFSISPV